MGQVGAIDGAIAIKGTVKVCIDGATQGNLQGQPHRW